MCRGDGTCEDGMTADACLSGGNIYAGNKSKCDDIKCRGNDNTNCVASVAGLDLKPGDLYAGGMVVGLYEPFKSRCFGATGFGGNKSSTWDQLMSGGSTGATLDNYGMHSKSYLSKYDYHGYGFTSDKGCVQYQKYDYHDHDISTPDSYYVIVSLSPVGITGDREIVNILDYPGATSEFYWGNRGSSWGPLYNQNTVKLNDISNEYVARAFKMGEGYWYNQALGEGSLNNIAPNTFTTCRKARRFGNGAINKLKTKPFQTAHGYWNRNWGLYNNIRVISADNALSEGYTDSQNYYSSDFGPGLTADYVSAFRATRLMHDYYTNDDGITADSERLSGWYIPSQDEMAYVAHNCIDSSNDEFNLNYHLFQEGGVPINGWHWTSTGAFDESKGFTAGLGEGVINPVVSGATADPGTLAWAMKFDVNGVANNFLVGKKHRTHNKYKVRPIRLLRCDGQYATGGSENVKLWELPRVLRDSDKGINQD